MNNQFSLTTTFIVDSNTHGQRLDVALAALLPDYSRAKLSRWVKDGYILVNQKKISPSYKVLSMDEIGINIPESEFHDAMTNCQPEDIPLNVAFEDADLLIINKPAGLVVHPGAGNPNSTLVNALIHYNKALAALPRAGIVHRLDKDTSGLLMIAKHDIAYHRLINMMQNRDIHRHYVALVQGEVDEPQSICTFFGRHPHNRLKMAVRPNGKEAVTHFDIIDYYPGLTLLDVSLETGRTHQIRVHMSHLGYPIVGDPLYGAKLSVRCGLDLALVKKIHNFGRQALHAARLDFVHPFLHTEVTVEADIPEDLQELLNELENASVFDEGDELADD